MKEEIFNAQITSTKLGREDHGILTFEIFVHISDNTYCGIGGYAIDSHDKDKFEKFKRENPEAYEDGDYDEKDFRVFLGAGLEAISKILDVVGVTDWEDLPGKFIRVKSQGWGSTIDEIGNLMKDKWFNLRRFFSEAQKDE